MDEAKQMKTAHAKLPCALIQITHGGMSVEHQAWLMSPNIVASGPPRERTRGQDDHIMRIDPRQVERVADAERLVRLVGEDRYVPVLLDHLARGQVLRACAAKARQQPGCATLSGKGGAQAGLQHAPHRSTRPRTRCAVAMLQPDISAAQKCPSRCQQDASSTPR